MPMEMVYSPTKRLSLEPDLNNPDHDGDGITDGDEFNSGMDPLDASDGPYPRG